MLEKLLISGRDVDPSLKIPLDENDCSFADISDAGVPQACCTMVNQSYVARDYVFLPYVPGHINFCMPMGRDVISAPFSGCLMVHFIFTGPCLFGNNPTACSARAANCHAACPYRNAPLVAHVAYETRDDLTCQHKWQDNLLLQSINVYGFFPDQAMLDHSREFYQKDYKWTPITYGLITARMDCFSIVVAKYINSPRRQVLKSFAMSNRQFIR